MSAALLHACLEAGIQLWPERGELCLRGPKSALTAERRDALRQHKPALLALLTADARYAAVSYAQKRLWFLDQFQPGSSAFTMESAMRLHGALDEVALQQALDALVGRHEALRTTFANIDGNPVQVIRNAQSVSLCREDLSTVSGDSDTVLADFLRNRVDRTFCLATGPLFRATVVRLGDRDHCLILQLHHIVGDGWSMKTLLRDFSAFYSAAVSGESPALPPFSLQYAEWARQQRQRVEADDGGHLSFWKARLAGPLPTLDLPTDMPRMNGSLAPGGRTFRSVSSDTTDDLKAFLRGEGATPFMGFLAVYAMTLSRHTGQRELTIGYPVSGRDQGAVGDLIGLFVNVLVIRLDLSRAHSFRECVRLVRNAALEALEHQEVPFERLVEALQPDREMSRTPLFQTLFGMQNFGAPTVQMRGLTVSRVQRRESDSKFDFALFTRELDGTIEWRLEYRTDLFVAETPDTFLARMELLMRSALAEPDSDWRRLYLSETAEIDGLHGSAELADTGPAPTAFERCVRQEPGKPAIRWRNESWSYQELDDEANRIAHFLLEHGVGPETLVGICMRRSPHLVASLLGVWKAGCAYVPLDPRYPRARLEDMAEQAALSIILTETACLSNAPDNGAKRFCLDSLAADLEVLPATRPATSIKPDMLAYTIFTSGSTGRPKGVQIEHGALSNFLASMAVQPGIGPDDVLAAVTTLAFDISGLELFLPLTHGATVALLDGEAAWEPGALSRALHEMGATIFQATPATYRMLLDRDWPGESGLRLLCGGEAMSRELGDRLLAISDDVWNLYGPTETTIWSTIARVTKGDGPIPVGSPIHHTGVWILDDHMQPVPRGVPGELCISGRGVARGYVGRPELTTDRFIHIPERPGLRLYRTGDRARVRYDGSLEYLGRLDHQIKLRGFRIEPREIESALESNGDVAEAVIGLKEAPNGEATLVAYCRASNGPIDIDALRRLVAEQLPAYMAPSYYVCLDAFPTTPNGKLDRRALPQPDYGASNDLDDIEEPRGDVESGIAHLFSELLGVARVGAHGNFFHLGGHSLLATQLVSRLRDTFGVDVPLRALFTQPTPAGLAQAIQAGASSSLEEIRPSMSLSEQLAQLEHAPRDLEILPGE